MAGRAHCSPDALIKVNNQPPAASQSSVGCALAGCLGGLLLGFFGSALILIVLAFFSALDTPIAPPLSTNPDLDITLTEEFLNRFAQQSAADNISIDVLPGNRVQVLANTVVQVFGMQVPVQITGLFEIQLIGQSLQVVLLETQVAGIDLDLSDFFKGDIAIVNQDIQTILDEVSTNVGTPVTATGLSTTETQIHIEVTETP